MSFSSLRKFAITPERTARLELPGILLGCDAPPVLELRHAGEENIPYVNARAKAQAELKAIGGGQSPAAQKARYQANARMLARGGVVVSWENVRDDDGTVSPCTPDKVEEFLLALIESTPDLFGMVLTFIWDVSNFRPAPVVDAELLGKP